jgi:hypothetical protein
MSVIFMVRQSVLCVSSVDKGNNFIADVGSLKAFVIGNSNESSGLSRKINIPNHLRESEHRIGSSTCPGPERFLSSRYASWTDFQ